MISKSDLQQLNQKFKGEILTPDQPGYEEARKVWNGMIDKKPGVILRCTSSPDISAAVNFARNNKYPLSVKGGGHGIAGFAVNDGGVMIDLSLMRNVKINENEKKAYVDGGCLFGDLDKAAHEFGLAVPGGIISHTGVAGLTLGGGFGWISRKFGFSIDNLLSCEVVTADGKILKASENENEDLFWGLRGGGGNFGVVSSFEFQCSDLGKEVFSGLEIRAFKDAKKYFQFYRDYVRTLPDEMTVWCVIRKAPPLPFLPEEFHGQLVIISPFVFTGDKEKGEELMKPFSEHVKTIASAGGMHPWPAWQSGFDALNAHYFRNYWKSHNIKEISDEFIDEFLDLAQNLPGPLCELLLLHMEGKPSRVPEDATAYSYRKIPFVMNSHIRWENKDDDQKFISWAQQFFERTKPFSEGVYVNFLSNEGDERTHDAYTNKAWKKLSAVKKKYDPENLFKSNHNIKPE